MGFRKAIYIAKSPTKPRKSTKSKTPPALQDTPQEARGPGRPTDFSQRIALQICEEVSDGPSLRRVCEAEELPTKRTVQRWLAKGYEDIGDKQDTVYARFCHRFARAREMQAESLFDDAKDVADDGTNDYMESVSKKGIEKVMFVKDNVLRSRLRVDTYLTIAERQKPKKYAKMTKFADAEGEVIPPSTVLTLADVLKKAQNGA